MSRHLDGIVKIATILNILTCTSTVCGYNGLPLSRGGSDGMDCYDCYRVVGNAGDNIVGGDEDILGYACFHYLDADLYPDKLNHSQASKRFKYFTVSSGANAGDLYCTAVAGQVLMKPYGFLPIECTLGLCVDLSGAVSDDPQLRSKVPRTMRSMKLAPPGVKLRNCVGASVSHVLDKLKGSSKTTWDHMISGIAFRQNTFEGRDVTDLEICRCKSMKNCKRKLDRLLFPRLEGLDDKGGILRSTKLILITFFGLLVPQFLI